MQENAEIGWNRLEYAGMAGNGWKSLEIARNG